MSEAAGGPPQPGKQVPRRDEGSGYRYWLYTPQTHNADSSSDGNKKWPLLIFLHGAGESGSDLNGMISEGATGCPPVEIAEERADPALTDNFVVASPQTDRGWSDAALMGSFVKSLLGSSDLSIDPGRVYCTGVSMGGGGAWLAGTTGLFAAVAPVCGTHRVNEPETLNRVDVWAFHGANDVVVPVGITDVNVERLREHRKRSEGAEPNANARKETDAAEVKYTRYEKSPAPVGWESYEGHASWIQAYKGSDLWRWFLTKAKE